MQFPQLDRGRYTTEKDLLDRVSILTSGKGPAKVALLSSVVQHGAEATYSTLIARKRTESAKAKVADALTMLIDDFNALGTAGLFVPPPGRGGDFLINYSRGLWAEQILAQGLENTGEFVLVSYGPSTPPMPGEDDYRASVGTFELITALEGKRPDSLLFDAQAIRGLGADLAALVAGGHLARTPENELVVELVRRSCGAVEVKSSLWLAKQRNDGSLSVTVKDEELIPFESWQTRYQKPIIFAQVFFDSAYVLNYKTVKHAIATGTLDGFEVIREKDRKTGKMTNRLPLARPRYFADVPFPNKSEAKFMVVGGAAVAPYIQYQGGPATNLNLSLLRDAIRDIN